MTRIFEKTLPLPCSAQEAFRWHERPDALEKLIPPGDPVRVREHRRGKQGWIGDGARVILEIGRWPFRMQWVAVHDGYLSGERFVDTEAHGPFAFWRHTHAFRALGPNACELIDHVEYRLPLGWLGDAIAHALVEKKIESMFAWRHEVTARELSGNISVK